MKAWSTLALAALAAVVLGQLLVRQPPGGVAAGTTPPSFSLPRIGGGEIELAALRGRVVAVNFWATWCPPCLRELPMLSAARQAGGGRCLEVLGVAEESASADVAAAAARLSYPVVTDPRAQVATAWGVTAYPRTYLLDRQGRVERIFEGELDRRELEAAAAPLLGPGCQVGRP